MIIPANAETSQSQEDLAVFPSSNIVRTNDNFRTYSGTQNRRVRTMLTKYCAFSSAVLQLDYTATIWVQHNPDYHISYYAFRLYERRRPYKSARVTSCRSQTSRRSYLPKLPTSQLTSPTAAELASNPPLRRLLGLQRASLSLSLPLVRLARPIAPGAAAHRSLTAVQAMAAAATAPTPFSSIAVNLVCFSSARTLVRMSAGLRSVLMWYRQMVPFWTHSRT